MNYCVMHDRIKMTLGDKTGGDLTLLVGQGGNDVSSLQQIRHVRQNPDLGRAQMASLLRAARRVRETQEKTAGDQWSRLMSDMAARPANEL